MHALLAALLALAPEYTIYRASSPIVIDGKLDEADWQNAPPVGDFTFNWFTSGEKEQTVARLLWDDQYLYVSWLSRDRHISAYVTERHGPVSRDDCVEIFLSPNPAKVRNYYTFEINAIGTMLNRNRTDWWTGPPTWEPEGVRYRTSLHGLPRKDESPGDTEWTVELAIPFSNFARDAAHTPPRDGDPWRLNLMRTGGRTNAQDSTWSPIPPPSRSFHTPEAFGPVRFSMAQPPPRTSAEAIGAGRAAYNANCTACHGLDGDIGDRAPALAARRRYLRATDRDLFDAIKNGIKGTLMPSSPLPASEVWQIVAYIRSLRTTAADVPIPGDPARGAAVFSGKGGCVQCHTLNGRGGLLGPDLSDIGGTRRLEVIRAALTRAQPQPPRGYQPVSLTTRDGRPIRGVVKNENNFSLQILGADEKLHLLLRKEIGEITYDSRSLMPSDFDRKLTRDEFQDLLAFLGRQARGRQP